MAHEYLLQMILKTFDYFCTMLFVLQLPILLLQNYVIKKYHIKQNDFTTFFGYFQLFFLTQVAFMIRYSPAANK